METLAAARDYAGWMADLARWGLALFVAVFVAVLILIVLFVLEAVGLHRMAKNRGLPDAWLAFVPIGHWFVQGLIIREIRLFGLRVPRAEIVLPAVSLLVGALGQLHWMVLGAVLTLVWLVVGVAAFYRLMRMYAGGNAALYTILSVVFPFQGFIFIFALRNRTAVEV
jgi:hypothetical protein